MTTRAVATLEGVERATQEALEAAGEDVKNATAHRDALIVQARRAGNTLRAIGHHAGLTHAQVRNILLRDDPTYPQRGVVS